MLNVWWCNLIGMWQLQLDTDHSVVVVQFLWKNLSLSLVHCELRQLVSQLVSQIHVSGQCRTLINYLTGQRKSNVAYCYNIIITLQILIIKVWMRYKLTLYCNKIIPSLLCWIIMVILLPERHPKNTNAVTHFQIITELTNFLLPVRQI